MRPLVLNETRPTDPEARLSQNDLILSGVDQFLAVGGRNRGTGQHWVSTAVNKELFSPQDTRRETIVADKCQLTLIGLP